MEKKKSIEKNNIRENFDDQEKLHFTLSKLKRTKKKRDKSRFTQIMIYLSLITFTSVCIMLSIIKIEPFTFFLIIVLSLDFIYFNKKRGKKKQNSNVNN